MQAACVDPECSSRAVLESRSRCYSQIYSHAAYRNIDVLRHQLRRPQQHFLCDDVRDYLDPLGASIAERDSSWLVTDDDAGRPGAGTISVTANPEPSASVAPVLSGRTITRFSSAGARTQQTACRPAPCRGRIRVKLANLTPLGQALGRDYAFSFDSAENSSHSRSGSRPSALCWASNSSNEYRCAGAKRRTRTATW